MVDEQKMKSEENPFFNLFPSREKAQLFSSLVTCEQKNEAHTVSMKNTLDCDTNRLLELIFLMTANKDFMYEGPNEYTEYAVFVGEEHNEHEFMLLENLENMLTERLMLKDPQSKLVSRSGKKSFGSPDEAGEKNPVVYLLACHSRCDFQKKEHSEYLSILERSEASIIQHLALCFLNPDMFSHIENAQKTFEQTLFQEFKEKWNTTRDPDFLSCLQGLTKVLVEESFQTLEGFVLSICNSLAKSIASPEVLMTDPNVMDCLNVLVLLSNVEEICKIMLKFEYKGRVVAILPPGMTTILGLILCKSSLVTDSSSKNYPFFSNMSNVRQSAVDDEEILLHNALDVFHSKLHVIFLNITRIKSTKEILLSWIGNVLKQNAEVGKLWLHQSVNPMRSMFQSDGVFLNLSSVFVRLAQPFCITEQPHKNTKFLKIDPSYCLSTNREDRNQRGVHIQDLHKETCLTKHEETKEDQSNQPMLSSSYGFVSECFFMAHYSLHLGMHGLLVKFYRLNRELSQLQTAFQEIQMQGLNPDDDPVLKETFERAMSVYLSTKSTLSESTLMGTCMRFHATTATFLNHVACSDDRSNVVDVTFPLLEPASSSLQALPEFLVENVKDYMLFLKRFSPSFLEQNDVFLSSILDMCTIYMGNKSRMYNPHLRASLAEVLEAILPLEEDNIQTLYKQTTFQGFKHVEPLTDAVVQLFVDIEFTGDPDDFENKANGRRPLYPILKFLWKNKRGKHAIKNSAIFATANIDSSSPPLLLQFVNLFLNDSIYLLDEAVKYLTQIKQMEHERDDGQWQDLPAREKKEKESFLSQIIKIARYHCVMSNETIDLLAYMSEAVEFINLLCQPSLIDRVTSMLNSFLLRLVGPEMGKLKIRDFSNCEFKPKELVLGICKIYIHVGVNDDFPNAVAKDERSYRSDLFPRAMRVMGRYDHSDICFALGELSARMQKSEASTAAEDEKYKDAPDEFFDPLLGTLMKEPVILPTSKITIDRSTIARHLLSDTTDPFNRQPLKLEDVIPDVELAKKIKSWDPDNK